MIDAEIIAIVCTRDPSRDPFSSSPGASGYPFGIPRDHTGGETAECDEIPAVPRGSPLILTGCDRDRSIDPRTKSRIAAAFRRGPGYLPRVFNLP